MNTNEDNQYYYRIIIIGNVSVGKTSLLNQLTDGLIKETYKATLGMSVYLYNNCKESILE